MIRGIESCFLKINCKDEDVLVWVGEGLYIIGAWCMWIFTLINIYYLVIDRYGLESGYKRRKV